MFNELDILRCYYKEVKAQIEGAKALPDEWDHDRKILSVCSTLGSIDTLTDFVSRLMESRESEQG